MICFVDCVAPAFHRLTQTSASDCPLETGGALAAFPAEPLELLLSPPLVARMTMIATRTAAAPPPTSCLPLVLSCPHREPRLEPLVDEFAAPGDEGVEAGAVSLPVVDSAPGGTIRFSPASHSARV